MCGGELRGAGEDNPIPAFRQAHGTVCPADLLVGSLGYFVGTRPLSVLLVGSSGRREKNVAGGNGARQVKLLSKTTYPTLDNDTARIESFRNRAPPWQHFT